MNILKYIYIYTFVLFMLSSQNVFNSLSKNKQESHDPGSSVLLIGDLIISELLPSLDSRKIDYVYPNEYTYYWKFLENGFKIQII